MDEAEKVVREAGVTVAREVILEDFQRLVHDLDCDCPNASPTGALAALVLADWSVADATHAWLRARGYER